MKLIRHGSPGKESPGVILKNGDLIDVTKLGQDYNEEFFATDGLARLGKWLGVHASTAPKLSMDVRLGPPICRPSKIVCIGLNQAENAKEGGMEIPTEPILFFK